jgi:group II intron reverse transcriptase/maturase
MFTGSVSVAASITANPATGSEQDMKGPVFVSILFASVFRTCTEVPATPIRVPPSCNPEQQPVVGDFHRASYGFRRARSVHHAIRTVKMQLQESDDERTAGRWVIEGDLASYFDTVHHRLLLKGVRKRIADRRFLALLWKFIKAGCVDRGLFCAASEGVPQGGVISPLLSNIMLHEFDEWMEANYLSKKVRKDRWAWNFGILKRRPIAVRENRQWKPAISYCRYADDFVLVVKGTKADAEAVREACRAFLEDKLKLTLNMEKTHITHVNDGFVFLGHRIIRKRGPRGRMRPVTTIPWAKYRGFTDRFGDVEHIKPKAIFPVLEFEWENLGFVCARCNNAKRDFWSDETPVIDTGADPADQ